MNPRLVAALLALAATAAAAANAAPDAWARLDAQVAAQYRGGDYATAQANAEQALAIAEGDRTKVGVARQATSLNALALIQQAQGRYAEAQTLLERALSVSQQALPADHPNIAALRANLASLQEARRQQDIALDAHRGQELNEQALALHERGEYEQAAALYEQALPIVEQHFGVDSVEAARVLASLADTHAARKQYEQAEALYRRALAIYERRDGETVAQAGTLNALASVLYLRRQYGQAEPLFQRALQLLEAADGPDHVDLLPVLDNLHALYLTTRRDDRADAYRRRAAAIRKAHGLDGSE